MPFRAPVKIWICLCMGRCRLPADNPYTKGRRNWNKGVLKAPLLFHFVERRRTLDMFPLLSSEEINGAIVTVFKRSKIRLFTEHTKTERNTLSLPWNTAAVWPACLPCKDLCQLQHAGTTQKPITLRKFSVRDFPAARPSSDCQICLDGRAENKHLPLTSLLVGMSR